MNRVSGRDGAQVLFPFRFQCQRCASCCRAQQGSTSLTRPDVARISAHLALPEAVFITDYCYIRERHIYSDSGTLDVIISELCLRRHGADCLLLDVNVCTVEPVKPLMCKAYPFIESVDHILAYKATAAYCRGFDQGPSYDRPLVEDLIAEFNREYYNGIAPFAAVDFDFSKVLPSVPDEVHVDTLKKSECLIT